MQFQAKEEIKMSLEEAIKLLQIHERARQGRIRSMFMREIRQQEERERMAANRGAPTLDPDVAATRIQKVKTKYIMEYTLNNMAYGIYSLWCCKNIF